MTIEGADGSHDGHRLTDGRHHPGGRKTGHHATPTRRAAGGCESGPGAHRGRSSRARRRSSSPSLAVNVKKGGDGGLLISKIAEASCTEETDPRVSPTARTSPTKRGMRW